MRNVYPGATVWPSPSAWTTRNGCESWPQTLVIHATQAGGGTGRDVAYDFWHSSQKCTHFVIDKDGSVYQHADPLIQAAAGNGSCTSTSGYWDRNTNGNWYTVSIEIFKIDNGEKPTEAQYHVLGELSNWICDLCHIPRKWCDSKAGGITSHGFFDPVHRSNVNGPGGDPGTFDWARYFASLTPSSEQPWYMYPIRVPFGNPDYDVGLGGSHDMTVVAPANAPVSSIVSGIVSDISAPEWGKQVGILLDTPVGDVKWFHYLHLSAVQPALKIGSQVRKGDVIGWVGGGNTQAHYAGTSNPTGQNFCNTTYMSNSIQVGIALMRGPAYGGKGWQTFPPIDMTLDPTPLLIAARQEYQQKGLTYMEQQFDAVWLAGAGIHPDGTQWKAFKSGIYQAVKAAFLAKVLSAVAPSSDEVKTVDWAGRPGIWQKLDSGDYAWYANNHCTIYNNRNQAIWG